MTAGVIHKMVDSRTQAGRSVFYLQLTDLKDNYINVFLHGEKGEYASFPVGGLVYLINPDIVPSKDGRDHVALSVPSSRHIQFIGHAMDYGVCCSLQRNGQKCPNAVNKEVSRYCMYHVRKTQETINAMRGDLSSCCLSSSLSCSPPDNELRAASPLGRTVSSGKGLGGLPFRTVQEIC